jgi:hypothetical protein
MRNFSRLISDSAIKMRQAFRPGVPRHIKSVEVVTRGFPFWIHSSGSNRILAEASARLNNWEADGFSTKSVSSSKFRFA